MPPIVQDMLMSLVRKGLVIAGTYIISHGIFTAAEWENYAAGLAVIVVGAAWSLLNKYVKHMETPQ